MKTWLIRIVDERMRAGRRRVALLGDQDHRRQRPRPGPHPARGRPAVRRRQRVRPADRGVPVDPALPPDARTDVLRGQRVDADADRAGSATSSTSASTSTASGRRCSGGIVISVVSWIVGQVLPEPTTDAGASRRVMMAEALPSLPSLPGPRGTGPAYSVAFVCLGNICRSPTAEAVMTAQARPRQGSTATSSSAARAPGPGTSASRWTAAPRPRWPRTATTRAGIAPRCSRVTGSLSTTWSWRWTRSNFRDIVGDGARRRGPRAGADVPRVRPVGRRRARRPGSLLRRRRAASTRCSPSSSAPATPWSTRWPPSGVHLTRQTPPSPGRSAWFTSACMAHQANTEAVVRVAGNA